MNNAIADQSWNIIILNWQYQFHGREMVLRYWEFQSGFRNGYSLGIYYPRSDVIMI